jgi:hypothetical protein
MDGAAAARGGLLRGGRRRSAPRAVVAGRCSPDKASMLDKLVGLLLLAVGILLVTYLMLDACQCSYCGVWECFRHAVGLW